jgi:4-aminobutyrate aminotransferase/(S)-3-amino-2-methylpropionate transaminase
MLAFDVVPAGSGDEPDGAAAKRVTRLAFEHGLVILTCGAHGETIRVLVPLTVPDEVLEEGLDILGQALQLARSNP